MPRSFSALRRRVVFLISYAILLPSTRQILASGEASHSQCSQMNLTTAYSVLLLALLAPGGGHGECTRQADPGQCDAYVDCIQGVPTPTLCPDGLVYSPESKGYPCHYPQLVDCAGRTAIQRAQPTAECPHKFGLFRIGDANNCGLFLSCVHGRGYSLTCPEGLAFNEQTLECDWPDLVSSCNPEGFLGFTCPVTFSQSLGYPAGHRLYRSPNDCALFYVCEKDRPRLLRCPQGQAFNEIISSCDDPANVTGCSVGEKKYSGSNQVPFK